MDIVAAFDRLISQIQAQDARIKKLEEAGCIRCRLETLEGASHYHDTMLGTGEPTEELPQGLGQCRCSQGSGHRNG